MKISQQLQDNEIKEKDNEIIKKKADVDSHITQIEKNAKNELDRFKEDVLDKKTAKINKEISEKKLKETKDELTKKENELYSKKAEKFLINRKINPKIKSSDLQKSYVNTRGDLENDINSIKINIDALKEQKKSIKQ
jgi:hypothetical protein